MMDHLSGGVTLHSGDCLDILPTLAECSIDSCVTDPPYGLSFMGRNWDHGVPGIPFWKEVYRVLKPGAHLVAFGGSRTYHRMACAIEDAGFEIRDSLMWVYGQGFPKSHDVSKGIDKAAGAERTEVIGKSARHGGGLVGNGTSYEISPEVPDITAPATDAAREWQGFGTALKPAFEPIVLARKPLSESTVAANVLRWRTGALNIDGCRIGTETRTYTSTGNPGANTQRFHGGDGRDPEIARAYAEKSKLRPPTTVEGRWPANVVLDHSTAWVGAITAKAGARVRVKDLKITAGTNGYGLVAKLGGYIEYIGVNFGAVGHSHMTATDGGLIAQVGAYTISGGGQIHFYAQLGGKFFAQGGTITLSGTPAFSVAFAQAVDLGLIVSQATYSGSATGKRYNAASGGMIETYGAGTSHFPGNSAGTGTNFGASPYGMYQ